MWIIQQVQCHRLSAPSHRLTYDWLPFFLIHVFPSPCVY